MKTKKWDKWMLVLFVPLVFAAVQAFAQSELIIKTDDFIPANIDEKWLAQWTFENIGKGFFNQNWNHVMLPKNQTMF